MPAEAPRNLRRLMYADSGVISEEGMSLFFLMRMIMGIPSDLWRGAGTLRGPPVL